MFLALTSTSEHDWKYEAEVHCSVCQPALLDYDNFCAFWDLLESILMLHLLSLNNPGVRDDYFKPTVQHKIRRSQVLTVGQKKFGVTDHPSIYRADSCSPPFICWANVMWIRRGMLLQTGDGNGTSMAVTGARTLPEDMRSKRSAKSQGASSEEWRFSSVIPYYRWWFAKCFKIVPLFDPILENEIFDISQLDCNHQLDARW